MPMETLKLFLASSFAAAAGLRGLLAFAGELVIANGSAVAAFLAGPSGMALEALASFIVGAVVAKRIASAEKPKASRT